MKTRSSTKRHVGAAARHGVVSEHRTGYKINVSPTVSRYDIDVEKWRCPMFDWNRKSAASVDSDAVRILMFYYNIN